MLPRLNRKRARFVLTKIDEILAWGERSNGIHITRALLSEGHRVIGLDSSSAMLADFKFVRSSSVPQKPDEVLDESSANEKLKIDNFRVARQPPQS